MLHIPLWTFLDSSIYIYKLYFYEAAGQQKLINPIFLKTFSILFSIFFICVMYVCVCLDVFATTNI